MKNFVITVARGFGSGGRAIAAKLADELNIHSYDNRILTLASQYSGYPEHYFKEADETLNGSLITKQLQALPKRHSPTGELSRFTSDDRLFEYQKIIIEKLAASESCVIVGKCADYILKTMTTWSASMWRHREAIPCAVSWNAWMTLLSRKRTI